MLHDADPTADRPAPTGRIVINAVASLTAVLGLGLAVVGVAPTLLGYRSMVVTSTAMAPSMGPGDVVILRPTDGADLAVGAVVQAERSGDGVLERIVGVVGDRYRIAPDATPRTGGRTVDDEEVRGVGVMVVPMVGLPMLWLEQGRWLPLTALGLALVVIARTASVAWIDDPPGRRRG